MNFRIQKHAYNVCQDIAHACNYSESFSLSLSLSLIFYFYFIILNGPCDKYNIESFQKTFPQELCLIEHHSLSRIAKSGSGRTPPAVVSTSSPSRPLRSSGQHFWQVSSFQNSFHWSVRKYALLIHPKTAKPLFSIKTQ